MIFEISFFIAGFFSSISHIGEPVKYLDLSITLRNFGFRNCHEISEVLKLYFSAFPYPPPCGQNDSSMVTLSSALSGALRCSISHIWLVFLTGSQVLQDKPPSLPTKIDQPLILLDFHRFGVTP